MNRPIAASALCLTTIFLNACGIVAPERTAYSAQWPSLPPAASRRCAPPLGMFANASGRENLGKDSGFAAPTLAQVLGVHSQGDGVTHVAIENAPGNKLRISSFDIVDGAQLKVGEQLLDLADSSCHEGRWTIATTPTHTSWVGSGQENYDPLFMVTMPIATMGLGLLAMPLSDWWRFSFAVTDDGSLALRRNKLESGVLMVVFYSRKTVEDDWFLYDAADLGQLAAQRRTLPASLAVSEVQPLPETPLCSASDERSPAELYGAGMSFYRNARYEPALACLRMAAEAPDGASREAMWQLCIVLSLIHISEPTRPY